MRFASQMDTDGHRWTQMEERMAWNGSGDVHVATAERWSDGFSRSLDWRGWLRPQRLKPSLQ